MRVLVTQTRRFDDLREGVNWLRSVINAEADLIVLPENWIGIRALTEGEFHEYVDELSVIARELNALVIGGSAYVDVNGRVKSICPMVGAKGLINYSEKIFPSRATGERLRVSGGDRLGIVEMHGWLIGCVICVDAMYPEITRALARYGVHVIANPSSISEDRVNFWRSLGLVRAFENSAYYVASMGTGYKYPDGRNVVGGSFVASPNGTYPLLAPTGVEGAWNVTLSSAEVNYARQRRGYIEDLLSNAHANVRVSITGY